MGKPSLVVVLINVKITESRKNIRRQAYVTELTARFERLLESSPCDRHLTRSSPVLPELLETKNLFVRKFIVAR